MVDTQQTITSLGFPGDGTTRLERAIRREELFEARQSAS